MYKRNNAMTSKQEMNKKPTKTSRITFSRVMHSFQSSDHLVSLFLTFTHVTQHCDILICLIQFVRLFLGFLSDFIDYACTDRQNVQSSISYDADRVT